MKYIIAILFAIGSFISIVHWLNHFSLSPDSTNYITASENLVKHGSLFVYSNWPSKSFEPRTEPYTEYMPGLPIFTSVFFLFTDNPDTVMLVMNSVCIVLVYFIVLIILYELKLIDYLKIKFLLFLVFFEPFRFIFSHFWTETFFIFWSLLSVYFAVKLLKEDNKKYWMLGCIAVSLSAFIKMYGVFNCAFFLMPFVLHRKSFAKLALFVFASGVFVIIWYLRNEIIYGYFTSSHKIFQQFNTSNILRPFKWTLFLLGNTKLANVWAIVILVVGLSPLWFDYRKKITNNIDYKIWQVLFIGVIVNFFAIYFLSLVSSFDYLESRLLAPVYILCFFVFFMSIKILYEFIHPRVIQVKYLILALPIILFTVNPAFVKEIETNINIHYAWEHDLWNEINQKGVVENFSHYITEFNYIHQIYGNKPQRIIPGDSMFLNIRFMYEVTNKGKAPFVVLRNNELPYFYFDKLHKNLGYKKAELENKHFTVYVKNNN
ncbi:MAG: hypothetical protein J0M18_17465 [Ignavibacteria bacterium]|nr:hypothetical protein [Ignavibacteria bacterium]